MRLIPIPDATGTPVLWINADHLVSVQPQLRRTADGVAVAVELKVDGMPLQRIGLGEYLERTDADAAFTRFMQVLQGEHHAE